MGVNLQGIDEFFDLPDSDLELGLPAYEDSENEYFDECKTEAKQQATVYLFPKRVDVEEEVSTDSSIKSKRATYRKSEAHKPTTFTGQYTKPCVEDTSVMEEFNKHRSRPRCVREG